MRGAGSSTMHIVNNSFPNLQFQSTQVDNELSVENMIEAEVDSELLADDLVVANIEDELCWQSK